MTGKEKEGIEVVSADLTFLSEVQSAPVGRRGGDASSERGKIREFFFKHVLDAMIASQGTKAPISQIELTDVITRMRQTIIDKDNSEKVIPTGDKLPAGWKWKFIPNESDSGDRYRGIRSYLTGLLKARKEFKLEKKFSQRHAKDLTFIVYLVPTAAKTLKKKK